MDIGFLIVTALTNIFNNIKRFVTKNIKNILKSIENYTSSIEDFIDSSVSMIDIMSDLKATYP